MASATGAAAAAAGQRPKSLDFRFCDDMDAAEILTLVSEAYAGDCTGSSAFRAEAPIVSEEFLEATLGSPDLRWVALETPVPEERMVACCQFSIGKEQRIATVNYLAASMRGRGIGSYLLHKVEGVALGLGMETARLHLPEWRPDLCAWLEQCGYRETGGGLWEELFDDALLRPTHYLTYERRLVGEAGRPAAERPRPGAEGDGVLALVGTLISQLHGEAAPPDPSTPGAAR